MSSRGHVIIFTMSNQKRRPRTWSLWALCLVLGPISALPGFASEIAPADHVVVHKAEHKLYLYNGSRLLGEYKVALGLSPVGTKEREHDFRTPEGRYFLARRNTRSDFFLSIQVSYPNKNDELRARKNRWAPGGSIMIHGLPNVPKHPPAYYASNDWTDGCIALTNPEIEEVSRLVPIGTPVEIKP